MTFADSQHDKCQRFSVFNLSEFPEKPDLCLLSATAFPSQQSLKRHLKTYYYPPFLRVVLSKLQISPFATFHNALQQGTACFSQGGLTLNNVMYCKCDILQTNQRIYIQIWQLSLLCCCVIHYAFLAYFDLFVVSVWNFLQSIEIREWFGYCKSTNIFKFLHTTSSI